MEQEIQQYIYRGFGIVQYEHHYEILEVDSWSDETLAFVKTKKQIDKFIDHYKDYRGQVVDWRK